MGRVGPRFAYASLIAVLVLALGAAQAQAVTYDFTVSPPSPAPGEVTTFQLTPAGATVNQVRWDLDGDGDYDDGTTPTVTHSYAEPGPVTVTMRVREARGDPFQFVTKTITVDAPPAVDFGYTPADPMEGQDVAFTSAASDPEGDPVTLSWDFGDGTTSSDGAPTHAFAGAGTYSVVLTATDSHGAATTVTHDVTVRADPGPAASFEYAPAEPMAGDAVTFTSTSTPSQGSIATTAWDFDGDGVGDATGAEVSWIFADAGPHTVGMRVTQANGKQTTVFRDVEVAERPQPEPEPQPGPQSPPGSSATTPTGSGGGAAAPVSEQSESKVPTLMKPFPIVRIAGVVLRRGARVTILSVRAPRLARTRVECHGRGCPIDWMRRTSPRRLVRFHPFERTLRAGVRLEVFVRKPGRIGKYTRFLIRAGKPPARLDRCLMPGRPRPVRCP
jgi:PKD repeat protein